MLMMFENFKRWKHYMLKEKQLKREIKNLQHLLTSFHSAVNVSSIVSRTDKQGRIFYANDNFVRISGYSREELMGQSHSIVSSRHHSKAFWAKMWKEITKGNIWREEVCNRAKDGSLYWVDTFVYPYHDKNGNLSHFLSIRNDITNRKQQEQALHTQNKVLADIAWAQSHELRRPVASILGLVQLIQQGYAKATDGDMINHLAIMATELDTVIRKNVDKATSADYQLTQNQIVS